MLAAHPTALYDAVSRTLALPQPTQLEPCARIVVVCAGTSDLPVAEEAARNYNKNKMETKCCRTGCSVPMMDAYDGLGIFEVEESRSVDVGYNQPFLPFWLVTLSCYIYILLTHNIQRF